MYISEEFKKSIMENGRQISVKIQYDNVVLNKESIISCKKSFKGDMFKSIMQYVDIEIEGIHELKGKEVSVSLGVKYDKDDYEYIDWGTFIVDNESVENIIENNSTKFTAYDYLYKSHISYDLSIAYPITVKGYLKEICKKLGYNLMTNEFVNMDKTIDEEKYIDVYDNTYRDVLDEIAGSVGASICMKQNDLYIKYPTHTDYVLDENNLSSLKLSKKFGPINSLVLSLAPQEDNLYQYDNISISENGKTEIKISNNEIMNKKREAFIDNLFSKINGLYFFPFELDSFGYGYLEPYDIVTIKDLKGIEYPCLLLNGTSSVTKGFTESLSGEIPESAETDYSKATQSKKLLYQTILTVDKQKQTIDGVVKQQEENVEDISHLQISIGEIKTEVSKTSESIYKFEIGSGNIFDNCNQYISKNKDEEKEVVSSNMPLGINKDYLRGKDVCIAVDIQVVNAQLSNNLGNYIGAEFEVGYSDETKELYSTRFYTGQISLQYIHSQGMNDIDKRIYCHYKLLDKEITSVSNLKITINMDGDKIVVANPKVEFGTFPTGYQFDVPYVRDNVVTLQKDYTEIKQDIKNVSIKAVALDKEITTIQGDVSEVDTRLQEAELKVTPTEIMQTINEKLEIDGELKTTKYVFDKNGGHYMAGGLDIVNNNGDIVFYADADGNLTILNLNSVNGRFAGTINSSSIEASTINGGEINGANINTSKNVIIGNAIYLGDQAISRNKGIFLGNKSEISTANGYLNLNSKQGANLSYLDADGITSASGISVTEDFVLIAAVRSNAQVQVEANKFVSNVGLTVTGSDEKLKENVEDIDLTDLLDDFHLKSFNYIGNELNTAGVIAQDFMKNPKWKYVLTYFDKPIGKQKNGKLKTKKYLAVNYQILYLAGLQKLNKLEEEITILKKQVNELYKIIKEE